MVTLDEFSIILDQGIVEEVERKHYFSRDGKVKIADTREAIEDALRMFLVQQLQILKQSLFGCRKVLVKDGKNYLAVDDVWELVLEAFTDAKK